MIKGKYISIFETEPETGQGQSGEGETGSREGGCRSEWRPSLAGQCKAGCGTEEEEGGDPAC